MRHPDRLKVILDTTDDDSKQIDITDNVNMRIWPINILNILMEDRGDGK